MVLAFLGCLFLLQIATTEQHKLIIFLIAAGISVMPYFIRCETCKSSIYYVTGGKRNLFFTRSSLYGFLFAGQCPYCGMQRT